MHGLDAGAQSAAPRLPAGATLLLFVIGAHTLLDYSASKGAPGWRLSFALVFLTALLGLFLRASARATLAVECRPALAGILLLLVAGIAGIATQPVLYPLYVAGDMAMISLLLVLTLFFALEPHAGARRFIALLMAPLAFAALLAPATAALNLFPAHQWVNRFDPPHMLLIAYVVTGAACVATSRVRLLCIAAAAGLALLCFQSGQRTSVVLFAVAVAAVCFIRFGVLRFLVAGLVVTAACGAAIVASASLRGAVLGAALDSIAESRFESVAQGEDESLLGRVNEVRDVIRIAATRDSAFEHLLGHGHGATFRPYFSFPEPNVTSRNLVHNIHIVPALFYYRYGLIGLTLYLALWWLVISDLFRAQYARRPSVDHIDLTILVFMLGMLTNTTMRTTFNDPVTLAATAIYLIWRTRT